MSKGKVGDFMKSKGQEFFKKKFPSTNKSFEKKPFEKKPFFKKEYSPS